MLSLFGGHQTATKDYIRRGINVIPVWYKQGGIIFPVHGLHMLHRASDIQGIDQLAAEFENERQHFESGSNKIQVNDGTNWSTTLTMEGDALSTIASLIGQDMHTQPSIEFGKDYGIQGALCLLSTDPDRNARVCDVLFEVGVKLGEIPGSSDGEIQYAVELYGKNNLGVRIGGGHTVAFELFYDNGTTAINADAPEGTIPTFTLGHGNNSYATPAPADILAVRPGLGNVYEYLYYCKVNGVDVLPSEVSFNPATKVLTFTTAPAAQAKLEVSYLVDITDAPVVTGVPPHLWSGSNQMLNWKYYQEN